MNGSDHDHTADGLDRRIERAVRVARLAALWEAAWREASLPLGLAALVVALLWLGLREVLPDLLGTALVWAAAIVVGATAVAALLRLRARLPEIVARCTALARVESASGLEERTLARLDDELADEGAGEATRALWAAARRRAAARVDRLVVGLPHPDLPRRDRFALRPALGLLLFVGFFAAGDERLDRLAAGFRWNLPQGPADRLDVWLEPPPWTGLPPIGLMTDGVAADHGTAPALPAGSRLVARVTAGALGRTVVPAELAATPADAARPETAADPTTTRTDTAERRWTLAASGDFVFARDGREALRLRLDVRPDAPPTIRFTEAPAPRGRGGLRLAYEIGDDWGIASARARLKPAGPGRPLFEPAEFPLVLPAGERRTGRAETVRDLTAHPFAGAEVEIVAAVTDTAGHEATGDPATVRLPERAFRDPTARALIDFRRRLALDATAIRAVAGGLEGLTVAPERFATTPAAHLMLRELTRHALLARDDAAARSLVEELWAVAVILDAGDTADAARMLDAARDALAEALRNGASDAEIARLTRELKQAMDRYLEALAEAARRDPDARRATEGPTRRVDRKSLSDMLDRIEKLGRTGSREAAERLLSELGDTLSSLRGARPGEDAAAGEAGRALSEMIRRQRDLMERTLRAGRDGADGGERERMTREQDELRDAVRRLRKSLGSGESDAEAQDGGLGDADRAMDEAGRSLDRSEDGAALEAQGRAVEGLRRGARALAEKAGEGEDGDDPLGRSRASRGDGGRVGIPDEIEVERARRILDDIRRRLGEPARAPSERDYLDRLLKLD